MPACLPACLTVTYRWLCAYILQAESKSETLKVTKIALGQMVTVKQLKDDYIHPNLHSLLADKVMLNAGTMPRRQSAAQSVQR